MYTYKIGNKIEVDSLNELPKLPQNKKWFACIGGQKNFECFCESNKLSRAQFMNKYKDKIDKCHTPIYEDKDIIICQDAQIATPGFYIIATKKTYKKISDMPMELYQKCTLILFEMQKIMKQKLNVNRVFMYYDEHYLKPSSTHFWIMPIYSDVLKKYRLDPSIIRYDIWRYQELFEFKQTRNEIYKYNEQMYDLLKELITNEN